MNEETNKQKISNRTFLCESESSCKKNFPIHRFKDAGNNRKTINTFSTRWWKRKSRLCLISQSALFMFHAVQTRRQLQTEFGSLSIRESCGCQLKRKKWSQIEWRDLFTTSSSDPLTQSDLTFWKLIKHQRSLKGLNFHHKHLTSDLIYGWPGLTSNFSLRINEDFLNFTVNFIAVMSQERTQSLRRRNHLKIVFNSSRLFSHLVALRDEWKTN